MNVCVNPCLETLVHFRGSMSLRKNDFNGILSVRTATVKLKLNCYSILVNLKVPDRNLFLEHFVQGKK